MSPRRCLSFLFAASLGTAATAQCSSQWSPFGNGVGFLGESVSTMCVINGNLVVGGNHGDKLSQWNGSAWSQLGGTPNAGVWALLRSANGNLVVGGSFTMLGFTSASRIATWNGSTWNTMGGGLDNSIVSRVNSIAQLPNGDLVVGGWFSTVGGVACNKIARWNGSAWSPLGSGMDLNVYALAVLPTGDLVAAGNFTTAGGVPCANIARWNGSAWSPLGAGTNNSIAALAVLADGRLVAGGSFTSAGGAPATRIAVWDGSVWAPLGTGLQGSGASVAALLALPNGDLLAAGNFTGAGGLTANRVARWNGSVWSPLGLGLGGAFTIVNALTQLANGDVAAGGSFTSSGAAATNHVARFVAACPAGAVPYGSSCAGAAAPLQMTATSLPVLGAPYGSRTTGFVPGSLAIDLLGTAPLALPLDSVHPAGVAGCSLLVAPDLVFALGTPTAGTFTTGFTVATDTILLGAAIYAQVGELSLDAQGNLRIESSNALTLTFGTY
ncbi:MAG: hypothetical protein JNL08_02710 [Planctomycetes bacterium]|nr:hypothetical protein [Planctomycetota bacterium]